MTTNQASTRTEAQEREETTGVPADVSISKLRAAYNDAGGEVRAAAESFEADYHTVYNWLKNAGIHEVNSRRDYSIASRLEDASPDAVGAPKEEAGR